MSLLDGDAKILKQNATVDTSSAESKVTSNRKAGGQGLRRFSNINQFNAKIKEKKAIQTDLESSKSVTIEVPQTFGRTLNEEKTVNQEIVTASSPIVPQTQEQTKPVTEEVKAQEFINSEQVVTTASVVENTYELKKTLVQTTPLKTQDVSTSPAITEKKINVPESHVITAEIPRQTTVNTTIIPQEPHVNHTDFPREHRDNNHAKSHVVSGVQTDNDSANSFLLNIQSLAKYQRIIVNYMFRKCSQNGSNRTGNIFTNDLLLETGMKSRTYEDALARLLEGKFLTIDHVKKGRSGFRIFSINPIIFSQLIQEKAENKYHANHHVEHHGFPPSKEVSYYKNNITNYTQNPNVVISKNFNFKELDFSEVAPLHPMQVNSSIRKLAEEKLEKEDMQMFVDRFMVWVSTQKNVQNIIGLFCAKVKELAEEGDSPVMQVLSRKEALAEKEFLEQAKKLQIQEELTNKFNQEIRDQEINSKFQVWFNSITDEEKLKLVPEDSKGFSKVGSSSHTASLKAYFKDNIFTAAEV